MKKIFTFSFDDGVTQDKRLIALLRKYGLKATFNLNSALLGLNGEISFAEGVIVSHNKVRADEVKELYAGMQGRSIPRMICVPPQIFYRGIRPCIYSIRVRMS